MYKRQDDAVLEAQIKKIKTTSTEQLYEHWPRDTMTVPSTTMSVPVKRKAIVREENKLANALRLMTSDIDLLNVINDVECLDDKMFCQAIILHSPQCLLEDKAIRFVIEHAIENDYVSINDCTPLLSCIPANYLCIQHAIWSLSPCHAVVWTSPHDLSLHLTAASTHHSQFVKWVAACHTMDFVNALYDIAIQGAIQLFNRIVQTCAIDLSKSLCTAPLPLFDHFIRHEFHFTLDALVIIRDLCLKMGGYPVLQQLFSSDHVVLSYVDTFPNHPFGQDPLGFNQ